MHTGAPSSIKSASLTTPEISPLPGHTIDKRNSDAYQQMPFAGFTGTTVIKTQSERTLADLFHVKRGLATGANNYFILNEQQIAENHIPTQFLQPVLPGPRVLPFDEIMADDAGLPLIENRQFLLTCNLAETDIQAQHEPLWEYIQKGVREGIHKGYICSHRNPWYSQENRPACMFLCAYMGRQDSKRGAPFRFILNHSKATATNAYHMLYPKPLLQKVLDTNPQLANIVWQALNTISQDLLIGEGRVYGGGLHKMEPGELANVPAATILSALRSSVAFTMF